MTVEVDANGRDEQKQKLRKKTKNTVKPLYHKTITTIQTIIMLK